MYQITGVGSGGIRHKPEIINGTGENSGHSDGDREANRGRKSVISSVSCLLT